LHRQQNADFAPAKELPKGSVFLLASGESEILPTNLWPKSKFHARTAPSIFNATKAIAENKSTAQTVRMDF